MRRSLSFHGVVLIVLTAVAPFGWTVVVPAADETPPESLDNRQKLAAFARKTRLTRPTTASSAAAPIHITNKDLARFAGAINLTEVTGGPLRSSEDASQDPLEGGEPKAEARSDSQEILDPKRENWRNQYLAAKQSLIGAEAELNLLDEEISKLWSVFYSTDDPAYRDRDIRPKLDAAINRRETVVARIEEKRALLPTILGEAKRDGAFPGWFRDIK